jgi:hypothetical protein
VVNVAGALTAIQDGQLLEVDGDLGEVIVGAAASAHGEAAGQATPAGRAEPIS